MSRPILGYLCQWTLLKHFPWQRSESEWCVDYVTCSIRAVLLMDSTIRRIHVKAFSEQRFYDW